jgi:hypothetical protein
MNELQKREWVYVLPPYLYEISGCPVCKEEYASEWSEYKHHCWCEKCQKDYRPACDGVFGGPIPLGVAELLGTRFDRIYLDTLEVEVESSLFKDQIEALYEWHGFKIKGKEYAEELPERIPIDPVEFVPIESLGSLRRWGWEKSPFFDPNYVPENGGASPRAPYPGRLTSKTKGN